MSRVKPVIAVTMGDPAGVGPEICLQAFASLHVQSVCHPVLIGDASVLNKVCQSLPGLPCMPFRRLTLDRTMDRWSTPYILDLLSNDEEIGVRLDGSILVDCESDLEEMSVGTASKVCGMASYQYVEQAIEGAKVGVFDAVVTAPITKTAWHMAGKKYPGHTELFAQKTGIDDFAMLFYSPRLAVSFVTCHQSFRTVAQTLSIDEIRRVTLLTGHAMRRICGRQPRLAVLALNPHCGEDGLFGDEETRIILPAIEAVRSEGWDVDGPLPADSAFTERTRKRYDVFVTLYHDQGSIPFKMISMHDGVNVTMGLPIIRTSVDHGTAYDIAWKGIADPSSLISAIDLAAKLATHQSAFKAP